MNFCFADDLIQDFAISLGSEKMEVLLSADLGISWYPGCFYDPQIQKYCIRSDLGMGPGIMKKDFGIIYNTKIPATLALHFTMPTLELYEKMQRVVQEQQLAGEDIQVNGSWAPILAVSKQRTNVKPEFLKEFRALVRANKRRAKQYRKLCQALQALGCNLKDGVPLPRYREAEEAWFASENVELKRTGSMIICCRAGTQLYDYLAEHGVLEKVYPEWFRYGGY